MHSAGSLPGTLSTWKASMRATALNRLTSTCVGLLVAVVTLLAVPDSTLTAQAAAQPALSPELRAGARHPGQVQRPDPRVHDGFSCPSACRVPKGGREGTMQYAPGGMGVHFLNMGLVGPTLDPSKPQVLIYEPDGDNCASSRPSGSCRRAPGQQARRSSVRQLDGPMEGHHPHARRPAPLRPARLALEDQPGRRLRADESGPEVPEARVLLRGAGAQAGAAPGALESESSPHQHNRSLFGGGELDRHRVATVEKGEPGPAPGATVPTSRRILIHPVHGSATLPVRRRSARTSKAGKMPEGVSWSIPVPSAVVA